MSAQSGVHQESVARHPRAVAGGFTMLLHAVTDKLREIGIRDAPLEVFLLILQESRGRRATPTPWPATQRVICKKVGRDPKTVRRALRKLKRFGIVAKTEDGWLANCDPESWTPPQVTGSAGRRSPTGEENFPRESLPQPEGTMPVRVRDSRPSFRGSTPGLEGGREDDKTADSGSLTAKSHVPLKKKKNYKKREESCTDVQRALKFFKDEFCRKHGSEPIIDERKDISVLRRRLQAKGFQRVCEVIKAGLESDDDFYLGRLSRILSGDAWNRLSAKTTPKDTVQADWRHGRPQQLSAPKSDMEAALRWAHGLPADKLRLAETAARNHGPGSMFGLTASALDDREFCLLVWKLATDEPSVEAAS